MVNSQQPLVFTTENCELKPWGETGVRVRLPVNTEEDVFILRLDPADTHMYANQVGLRMGECITRTEDGWVTLRILNTGSKTVPPKGPMGPPKCPSI